MALFTTNSMMSFGNFRCFAIMFKVQIHTQIISQHKLSWLSLVSLVSNIDTNYKKQAGLSRATLEISSRISFEFPLWNMSPHLLWSPKLKLKIWGRTDQWLLRYSTFYILRSSSFIGIFSFGFNLKFWFGPLIELKSWGSSYK